MESAETSGGTGRAQSGVPREKMGRSGIRAGKAVANPSCVSRTICENRAVLLGKIPSGVRAALFRIVFPDSSSGAGAAVFGNADTSAERQQRAVKRIAIQVRFRYNKKHRKFCGLDPLE